MSNPKYPHINVPLVGEDGNAVAILGRCQRIARRAGLPADELDRFHDEATSGNYDHLLQTVMLWFSTDGMPRDEEEDSDE